MALGGSRFIPYVITMKLRLSGPLLDGTKLGVKPSPIPTRRLKLLESQNNHMNIFSDCMNMIDRSLTYSYDFLASHKVIAT